MHCLSAIRFTEAITGFCRQLEKLVTEDLDVAVTAGCCPPTKEKPNWQVAPFFFCPEALRDFSWTPTKTWGNMKSSVFLHLGVSQNG